MIVYKSLDRGGRSTYRKWEWPLPKNGKLGEWVKVGGDPVLCSNGFHGWLTREKAEQEGALVFEMELRGLIVRDHEKAAATEARLLRRVRRYRARLVERGLLPCRQCKKPHNAYRTQPRLAPQWGDLTDGHPYYHDAWDDVGQRLTVLLQDPDITIEQLRAEIAS